MSDFMGQVYEGLTNRSVVDDDTPFVELLGRLVRIAGSGKKAAALIGVSDTTFYRWRAGRQTPKTGAGTLVRAVRRAELPRGVETDVRSKARTMRVKGTITISGDVRIREVNLGANIPQRQTTLFVSAWLSGDDDRAERGWWRAVDTHVVEGLEVDNVIYVEFR
jgi:DNA-binding transcriptional regulator YdaS (Cro superfamily)